MGSEGEGEDLGALDQAREAGVESETHTLLHSIVAHGTPVKID